MTATPVNENGPVVDGATLSEQRFPYTTTAIERGQSAPYRTGRFGLKESFTHTPFDEFAEFRQRNPEATIDSVAFVTHNGTRYRVTIGRERL